MARIWPIGGGKGGSGKSLFVASLGSYLAKAGKETLLIDADLGGANLHTVIGIPHPRRTLSAFINKQVHTLEETIIETEQSNLFLISGARDSLEVANLPYAQKLRLLRAIYQLPHQYVLLDLGAGTSFNTLDFFILSNYGIFVTTPEPTSIENTYHFVRSAHFRKIRQVLKHQQLRAFHQHVEAPSRSPAAFVDMLRHEAPERAATVEKALGTFRFKLVLNQFRKQDDARLGPQICKVCEKHLGLEMQFLGNIRFDDRVHDAVCQKVSFVDKYPYTQTALDLRAISQTILAMEKEQPEARAKEMSASRPSP
jgi:flagellar biosynthesis protein FlhG